MAGVETHQPLSERLVALLAELDGALTGEVTEFAVRHMTDTLAIALAAAPGPDARRIVHAATRGSHGGACWVAGNPDGAPPAAAAFANAALAHLLDFDDIHDVARLHPTTVTLPAALAAAQLTAHGPGPVTRAVLRGSELMCRLGASVAPTGSGPASHWFLTQLLGYLGASVAAGTVLGLDGDELVSAIGLAAMQAAGSKQVAGEGGASARGIYPAFAAAGGLHSALLAADGVRGTAYALDGTDGLFPVYLGMDQPPELAADRWRYLETTVKPWPCCRISHPYVAIALALHRRLAEPGHRLAPARVHRIVLAVNASAAKLCHPTVTRRRPPTLSDAKYSIPFMTAHALSHGRVDLDTITADALTDAAVLELAARVEIVECLPDTPGNPPARITLHTTDAQVLDSASGELALDADSAAARDKVQHCMRSAGAARPDMAAVSLRESVTRLAAGDDSLFGLNLVAT